MLLHWQTADVVEENHFLKAEWSPGYFYALEKFFRKVHEATAGLVTPQKPLGALSYIHHYQMHKS